MKMGYQRASKDVQISLMPKFLSCLVRASLEHRNIILHNVLFHINDFDYTIAIEERKRIFACVVQDAVVLAYMLEYFADFLLLPYNLDSGMAPTDPAWVAPPSLSKEIFLKLKSEPVMNKDQIENAKLGILKFLTAEMLSPEVIICHLVIASGDVKHG
jgi:proteasome component ECM29